VSVSQENGAAWDYGYDGRYRLTSAVWGNDETSPTITTAFTYAYDGADNMVTKVSPFFDDFNDGNYTGWSVWGGSWSAANHYAESTGGTTDRLAKSFSEGDYDLWFSYNRYDADDLTVYLRIDGSDRLRLEFLSGATRLVDTSTQLAYNGSQGSAADTWYDVYVRVDGSNVTVLRAEQGELLEAVIDVSTATTLDSTALEFRANGGAAYLDDVRIHADGLPTTTAFAFNTANQLTKQTTGSLVTDFAYDAWGRMTSKDDGTYTVKCNDDNDIRSLAV